MSASRDMVLLLCSLYGCPLWSFSALAIAVVGIQELPCGKSVVSGTHVSLILEQRMVQAVR